MASRNRIAKHISRSLGQTTAINKGVIYTLGFHEIAHGLLIEGTPYKDTVYVWHLRLPFFYPWLFRNLTYCDRIPSNRAGNEYYFQGDDKTIADTVVERIIETGLREKIQRPVALGDLYVLSIDAMPERYNGLPFVFEMAMAHHLTGSFEKSAIFLDFLRQELAKPSLRVGQSDAFLVVFDTIERLLPLFDGPPAEVTARLRALIHENAARLGFVAAPPDRS